MLIVFKLLHASNGKYFAFESLMRISKKCLIQCLAHSRSFTSVSTLLLLPLFERRLPFLLLPRVSLSSPAHAESLSSSLPSCDKPAAAAYLCIIRN